MRYQRLGATLMVVAALIFWAIPLLAYEGSFRLPCEIVYRGEAPFVVTCEVTITAIKGYVVELARTPNGRAFVIENGGSNQNQWLLDHEKAVLVSTEPKPCYKNAEVQVCF